MGRRRGTRVAGVLGVLVTLAGCGPASSPAVPATGQTTVRATAVERDGAPSRPAVTLSAPASVTVSRLVPEDYDDRSLEVRITAVDGDLEFRRHRDAPGAISTTVVTGTDPRLRRTVPVSGGYLNVLPAMYEVTYAAASGKVLARILRDACLEGPEAEPTAPGAGTTSPYPEVCGPWPEEGDNAVIGLPAGWSTTALGSLSPGLERLDEPETPYVDCQRLTIRLTEPYRTALGLTEAQATVHQLVTVGRDHEDEAPTQWPDCPWPRPT